MCAYIYCLDMWLELKSSSVQTKMEDLKLEAVVGALGFFFFFVILRHVVTTWAISGSDALLD